MYLGVYFGVRGTAGRVVWTVDVTCVELSFLLDSTVRVPVLEGCKVVAIVKWKAITTQYILSKV